MDYSKIEEARKQFNDSIKRMEKRETPLSEIKSYGQLLDMLKNDDDFLLTLKYEIVKDLYGNNIESSTNIKEETMLSPSDNEYDFSNYILISNIKSILDERGLKQNWLQEKTQIPLSTLRSILNNEKSVSLENAFKISIVMGMPINSLFTFIDMDEIVVEL